MKPALVWVAILLMVFGTVLAVDAHRHAAAAAGGDAAAIRKSMDDQVAAWNRGDLDNFMTGYWNSPDVEFVSGNGVTRGYADVLARYKKSYPTQAAMGKLTFTDFEVHVECAGSAYAIGQFHLELAPDNPSGWFTLNFRKFKDGWKITVDHTTGKPKTGEQ